MQYLNYLYKIKIKEIQKLFIKKLKFYISKFLYLKNINLNLNLYKFKVN